MPARVPLNPIINPNLYPQPKNPQHAGSSGPIMATSTPVQHVHVRARTALESKAAQGIVLVSSSGTTLPD